MSWIIHAIKFVNFLVNHKINTRHKFKKKNISLLFIIKKGNLVYYNSTINVAQVMKQDLKVAYGEKRIMVTLGY